jgi:hypothetical protein
LLIRANYLTNMLRKISLANLALVVGGIIAAVGFAAYFTDKPTLNLAGFFMEFRCCWEVWP